MRKTALVRQLALPPVVQTSIREAANDGRVTLAARQLSDMSEADARRLYSQLKQLMDSQGDDE